MSAAVFGERRWAPRGVNVELDADGLLRPSHEAGAATTLSDLRAAPCLVLLGEPGLGKSTDMRLEAQALRSTIKAPEVILEVDLGAYGDERRIDEEVFRSIAWTRWVGGDHRLHLFLDGLDEAQLRIGVLWRLLTSRLASGDTSRLSLRLACRSASWQRTSEADLQQLWPEMRVLSLLPLAPTDVAAAAVAEAVDPLCFSSEARDRGVIALCSRPLTLRFLLRRFATVQTLPGDQMEVFAEGCALLSAEPDRDRRADLLRRERLSAAQRVAVASRVAALVLCSGRASLWTDVDVGEASVDDVLRRDVIGGTERVHEAVLGEVFPVDDGAVEETLSTALFSGANDPRRLRFAHRTIAEFLAGRWLATTLAPDQSIALLTEAVDAGRRIYPQLREVAAWVAARDRSVLRDLAREDPGTLLAADVRPPDNEAERILVAEFLMAIERGDVDAQDPTFRRSLRRLDGRTLADDLLTVARNRDLQERTRVVAIEIAEICGLRRLGRPLVEVALAAEAALPVRIAAAEAARTLAGPDERHRLWRLVPTDPVPEDPAENLRGAALAATWPDLVGTAEVLPRLVWPKRGEQTGPYARFAREGLAVGLDDAELPMALRWAAAKLQEWPGMPPAAEAADALLVRAWFRRDADDIGDALVELVAARLRQGGPWISREGAQALTNGSERIPAHDRRSLVIRLAECVLNGLVPPGNVAQPAARLLDADDVGWCTEQATLARGSPLEKVWSDMTLYATRKSYSTERDVDLDGIASRERRMDEAYNVFAERDPAAHYATDPEGTVATLVELVTEDLAGRDLLISPALTQLSRLWDARAEPAVAQLLETRSVAYPVYVALLRLGLTNGSNRIRAVARHDLSGAADHAEGSDTWSRSVDAAIALLLHAHQGWPEVWREMTEHPSWAVEMFGIMSHHPACTRLPERLTSDELVQLYTFLRERCWQNERDDGFFRTMSNEIVWYDLVEAGTNDAAAATRALRDAFPGDASLERAALRAERLRLERAWNPASPRDILALKRDARTRIVMTVDDLVAVVRESLRSLQRAISGPPPAAYDLWDTHAERPKSEAELADWLARGLRSGLADESVVVNREIDVRRRSGSEIGERVDIMIEAVAADRPPIRLPIEVKGSWNRTLLSALDEQLAERYLDDDTDHGIYLVLWFSPGGWTTADPRRRMSAPTYEGLVEALEDAARETLARTGRHVCPLVIDASIPYA